jgi:autotransporter translocation and assembly factor TamB
MKSDTLPSPRRTRLHRGILFSLFFCLMIFAGFFLALTTEFGFQLMLRTADSLSGPLFSVQEIQGKLFSDWRLGKVQVHVDQKIDVVLDELVFSWSPFLLFQKKLVVQQVAMQGKRPVLFSCQPLPCPSLLRWKKFISGTGRFPLQKTSSHLS